MASQWKFVSLVGFIVCTLLAATANATPVIIGHPLIGGRPHAADGEAAFYIQHQHAMPSAGKITAFHYFKQQATEVGNNGQLHFLVLRPTSDITGLTSTVGSAVYSRTYDVLYVSDPINTLNQATNTVHTYTLPTAVNVQAGDLFAHLGRGIPMDVNGTTANGAALMHISDSSGNITVSGFVGIVNGSLPSFTVGASQFDTNPNGVPGFQNHYRLHSIAVSFEAIPEPSTFGLASLGCVALLTFVRKRK